MEELINAHSYLIGKDCESYNDCGAEFIESFLNRDWGRSIVYQYNDGDVPKMKEIPYDESSHF